MKNLLMYVNPLREFDDETKTLVKIQIDNSLELGWKPEDILLVTNFPYEYNGIKAFLVGDENYNTILKQGTKIDTMCTLFDLGFFKEGELYWGHDFDAYQQEWITEEELDLGDKMGFTDYGRHERWNGGSFFFRSTDGDFFKKTKKMMYAEHINEEDVYMVLMKEEPDYMDKQVKRLNISYNFGMRKVGLCYEKALKPLKVLHFHPYRRYWARTRAIDIAMYGQNDIKKPLMSDRLIKIFQKHNVI